LNINKYNIFEKDDKKIAIAFCSLIAYSPFVSLINIIFNFFVPVGFIWDTVFVLAALSIIILISIPSLLKRFTIDMLFIFLGLLILFFISILINSNYFEQFKQMGLVLFIYTFPFYLFARAIRNFEIIHKYFKTTSIIIILSSFIVYILYISNKSFSLERMSYSYSILPSIIYIIYLYIKERKILYFFLSFIGVVIIFLGGSRGPLLCIVGFILIYSIINFKKYYKSIISWGSVVAVIVYLYSKYYIEILNYLYSILKPLQVGSRTLSLLLMNDIMNPAGRDIIYNQIWKVILNNPFGVGMWGDRFRMYLYNQNFTYSHNIFLELLTEYGIIFGSLIIIALIIIILKSLGKNIPSLQKDFICIFISLGLIPLLISGSYLQEPSFFIMLGFSINAISNYSKIKNHGSISEMTSS